MSEKRMLLPEYSNVKVVRLRVTDRYFSGSDSIKSSPKVGDSGTIVDVLHRDGEQSLYTVENVASTGHTIWLADFEYEELELVN